MGSTKGASESTKAVMPASGNNFFLELYCISSIPCRSGELLILKHYFFMQRFREVESGKILFWKIQFEGLFCCLFALKVSF